MTHSADMHPDRIPGYEGGPLAHRPELLDEPLFWLGHLCSCVQSEEALQTNDGGYSFRNPANRFALPADRLSRVVAALAS